MMQLLHVPEQEGDATAPGLPAPAAEGPLSLLNFVAQAVRDPDIDVAKLEALLRMQREIVADDAKVAFNQAMARLQPKLPRIKKNGEVLYPVNKNDPDGPKCKAFNYARWEDVDAAIRPLLHEEGFTLSFNTRQRTGDGGGVVVVGELLHVGGHAKSAEFALPLDTSGGKSNLQGYASSTSFGARYCAKLLLNLVFEGEDDDGQRGGMVFVTVEQQQQLTTLLRETRADLDAFLDFMGVGSVEGIQARDFPKALNALAAKKRQMAARAASTTETS